MLLGIDCHGCENIAEAEGNGGENGGDRSWKNSPAPCLKRIYFYFVKDAPLAHLESGSFDQNCATLDEFVALSIAPSQGAIPGNFRSVVHHQGLPGLELH